MLEKSYLFMAFTSVADPDDFRPDQTPEINADTDPDPALCKILYQVFKINFCLKLVY
jgi:hypothetical protein